MKLSGILSVGILFIFLYVENVILHDVIYLFTNVTNEIINPIIIYNIIRKK